MPTGNPPVYQPVVGEYDSKSATTGATTADSKSNDSRGLPAGWVRRVDPSSNQAFYVDTATHRTTWLHPLDDPEYLSSLPGPPGSTNNNAKPSVQTSPTATARSLGNTGLAKETSRVVPPAKRTKKKGWLARAWINMFGSREARAKLKADKERIKEEERMATLAHEQAAHDAMLRRRAMQQEQQRLAQERAMLDAQQRQDAQMQAQAQAQARSMGQAQATPVIVPVAVPVQPAVPIVPLIAIAGMRRRRHMAMGMAMGANMARGPGRRY